MSASRQNTVFARAQRAYRYLTARSAESTWPFAYALIAVFAFGLAAHAYCFLNVTFSHDSLYSVTRSGDYLAGPAVFGRFMHGFLLAIRGGVTAPWLIGLLSLFFLSIAAYFALKVLDVRSRTASILVCGLMATNLSVTAMNATYLHESDLYMLGLLLSVLAVYAFRKGTIGGMAAGALLLAGAMGFYQAYMSVTAVLLLALLVKDSLNGVAPKACVVAGCKMVGMLAVGFVVYYLAMRAAIAVTGVTVGTGYNSVDNIGDFSGVTLPGLVVTAWEFAINYLLYPEGMHTRFQTVANVSLFACAVVLLGMALRHRRVSAGGVAIAVVAVLLMPLAANASYVASKGVVHTLMFYAIFLYHPLCAVLAGAAGSSGLAGGQRAVAIVAQLITWALCALLVVFNIVCANQAYLLKQLQFEATEAVMTRVIDRMEQVEGYVPGETPVLFVGRLTDSELFVQRAGFDGVTAMGFFSDSSITYDMRPFIRKVLGYSMNIVSPESVKDQVSLSDVRTMDAFPDDDSCNMIDGVLVVKLADEIDEEATAALI